MTTSRIRGALAFAFALLVPAAAHAITVKTVPGHFAPVYEADPTIARQRIENLKFGGRGLPRMGVATPLRMLPACTTSLR